ncbi:MAG: gene transfer agent family protein [Alphaproteobacteria bacterium]|nr:gene transfer agent family protein [Alphaproteobacteria bacterium]MBL6938815.1 gene transfer agent family protein [Alphaproteobacteria bacterium]MBL7097828.1 gene transfer agent family protein [Alphaproteobacteria bacterium]
MPNRIRGEAGLIAGGCQYRLLLTLGALAEIEDGLSLSNLGDVAARLKSVRAGDLAIVAAALLRGGGHDLSPADVLRLPCDLGTLVTAVTDAFNAAGLTGVPVHSSSEAMVHGANNHPFAGAT